MNAIRPEAQMTVPVSADRDHIQGPDGAPVTLVEYGDYECSYCGAAYPVLKKIQAQMEDGLRFVFRNFPVTSSHPHAEKAAEAAEAAATQGNFWEMHDYPYEHQQQLTGEHLHAHAQVLGLDVKRFDQDLADNVYALRVREDFMSGVRSGVNGTPTFFINGVRYDGSHDLDSLLAAVRSAS
jgi:protein-disulfide isomerase